MAYKSKAMQNWAGENQPSSVENKEYKSKKLNNLVSIKKELEDKKLLIENPFFKYYLDKTNVILYGYNEIDPFYEKIFKSLDILLKK